MAAADGCAISASNSLTYKHQIVVNGQPSVASEYRIQPVSSASSWARRAVSVVGARGRAGPGAAALGALSLQALSPAVHVLLALSAQRRPGWGLRPVPAACRCAPRACVTVTSRAAARAWLPCLRCRSFWRGSKRSRRGPWAVAEVARVLSGAAPGAARGCGA